MPPAPVVAAAEAAVATAEAATDAVMAVAVEVAVVAKRLALHAARLGAAVLQCVRRFARVLHGYLRAGPTRVQKRASSAILLCVRLVAATNFAAQWLPVQAKTGHSAHVDAEGSRPQSSAQDPREKHHQMHLPTRVELAGKHALSWVHQ